MMKKTLVLFVFFCSLTYTFLIASEVNSKKVLYINSYHNGFFWSDGINHAIEKTLFKSSFAIEFKIFEMDTKRNQSETYKKEVALKAKALIEKFKPDIVITSDDNAVKYLLVPYFYNSHIPFVFCGVNGSAKPYGLPTQNVTGMIEVQLLSQLVTTLKKYAKGRKIGFLKGDSFSSKKELIHFEEVLNEKIESRFVTSTTQWKSEFLKLQKEVDILLIGNGVTIKGWQKSQSEIREFVKKHTIIPTGTWDIVIKELVVLTFANKAEEQGVWVAKTALEILKGRDISQIKLVKNKKAQAYINVTLAKKLNMIFPFEFIDNAIVVK